METSGPSTSTSSDTLTDRVAVYSKYFVKSFEKLVTKCRTNADVGSTVEPSKTVKLFTETTKPVVTSVVSLLASATVGQLSSEGYEILLNSWFSQVPKEQCIRLVDRLRSVSKMELRRMSVHAAVQLFASFECQFMSVRGTGGSWEFGLKTLADDGAYRTINYLLDCEGELVISEKVIIQGVLLGDSICTGTFNSVVPKNCLTRRMGMGPGYAVKLGETDIWTDELYEITGIVVLSENGGGDRLYGKRDTVHFRRKFDWEEKSDFPDVSPRRNTYCYVINESLAEELENKILNNINASDENIIRSRTLDGVNTGLQNQKAMQQTLEDNNLLLKTLVSSSNKQTEFESTTAFVKDLVKKPDIDWRDQETVQWNTVVKEILGALECNKDRGWLVAIYECESHDTTNHGFVVNVIAVGENFYDCHVSSNVQVYKGRIRMKTLKNKNKSHLEYPVSDNETSFTVVVGPQYLSAGTTATEQVFLLVTGDEPVGTFEHKLKLLGTVRPRIVKWGDISEGARTRVLQNGKVKIQGGFYAVEDAYEYLEGEQLNTLLRRESLQLFENQNFPVKVGYRDRWIEFKGQDVSEQLKRDDVVVQEFLPGSNYEYDEETVPVLQNYWANKRNNTKKIPYEEINGAYFWILFPERELLSTLREKLTFISAAPGDGKTSLLLHMHSNFSGQGSVVIFITALDLHQELVSGSDLHEGLASGRDATVMETLTKMLKVSRFEAEVLRRMKIVLLLDAFDEVETTDTVVGFLKKCMEVENIKIVVSLRSYLEGFVKEQFPFGKIYRLGSLMAEDQISIIENFWERDQGQSEDLYERASKILFMLPTGNVTPLMCELLASFWLNRDPRGDETRFHLHHLYKHLIDESLDRNLSEKLKVGSGLHCHNLLTTIQKQVLDAHVYLAFKQVFPKFADIFVPNMNTHTAADTASQGLLRQIEPPRFVHRTIAEYLVDERVFQIITGKVKCSEVFLDKFSQFSEFFNSRYVESENKQFLEDMLGEHGVPVTFKFNLDSFDIEKIPLNCFMRPFICKMVFSSFLEFSKENFITAVLKHKDPVDLYKRLLNCSAEYGYYDLFRLMWFEIRNFFKYPSIDQHSSMISFVTRNSVCINSISRSVVLDGKKQIVKSILESDPEQVTSQPATTPCLLLEGVSIDLIEILVSFNKNLLYQTTTSRENVLHSTLQENEYFQKFYLKFPDYFYILINLVDRSGWTPWRKQVVKAPSHYPFFQGVTPDWLKAIDFCVEPKRDALDDCTAFDRARICIDPKALLNEEMVGSTVWNAYVDQQPRIPLLSVFESCVEASGAKEQDGLVKNFPNDNELSPYFVATYVRDCITRKRDFEPEQFEQFLMNKVLETEGISFRHFITVYILEMLLRKTDEERHLQLSAQYVESLSANDSIFIVACKTGHMEVARLLFKSFSINWVTCLNDFQTMFFFRALDMHCGEFINEVVEKLVELWYIIPAVPVREALVTGNLNLFRIYVEKLGFTDERTGELSDGRGFGLMHHVLEYSSFDWREIREKKKFLIQYICGLFPSAMEHTDYQERNPKLVDFICHTLLQHLQDNGDAMRL